MRASKRDLEMSKLARTLLVSACVVGLAAIAAYAADQTILGKSFSVKAKAGEPTKVAATALEKNSNDTLAGSPTAPGSAGGAILQIFVNGGTPSSQSFVLSQGTNSKGKPFWSGDAVTGFKYSDSQGQQSAVSSLQISLKKGTFKIKASISGKNGPVSIVPPNLGTSACVAVQLGVDGTSGDRYSVEFGPDSKIANKDGTLFKATKPLNEGVCPSGPTTTTTSTTTTMESTTSSTGSTTTTLPTCTDIQPSLQPGSSLQFAGPLLVDASGTTSSCNSLDDLRFFWVCNSADSADCSAFTSAANADGNTHPQGMLTLEAGFQYFVNITVCSAYPPPPAICAPSLGTEYTAVEILSRTR
jgi:hypothetical protein